MVYKKYIKRGGKLFGPYYYRSIKKGGKVITQYVKNLPGKPDIVFQRKKVAVFVDSDFWHSHPKRFITPKTDQSYWLPKIARNKLRDQKVNKELRKNGWKVVRIWEFDIKKDIQKCLNKIAGALQ